MKVFYFFLHLQDYSPLHWTSENGSAETCKVLLLHGTKPNDGCWGDTGLPKTVQLKLVRFCYFMELIQMMGAGQWHWTSENSSAETCKVLLLHGTNPNVESWAVTVHCTRLPKTVQLKMIRFCYFMKLIQMLGAWQWAVFRFQDVLVTFHCFLKMILISHLVNSPHHNHWYYCC